MINLKDTFTDAFSRDGDVEEELRSCGELIFELTDNSAGGVEYAFVTLNEDKTILTIESNDPLEEG